MRIAKVDQPNGPIKYNKGFQVEEWHERESKCTTWKLNMVFQY